MGSTTTLLTNVKHSEGFIKAKSTNHWFRKDIYGGGEREGGPLVHTKEGGLQWQPDPVTVS